MLGLLLPPPPPPPHVSFFFLPDRRSERICESSRSDDVADDDVRMDVDNYKFMANLKKNILNIFSEFMTRVTKFDELVAVGNRLLVTFQQGLEFLRRPPIDTTSKIVANIIESNKTKRMLSYVEVGCANTHDTVQSMNKSKCIVDELEHLVEDVTHEMQTANEIFPHSQDKYTSEESDLPATICSKEMVSGVDPQLIDYATIMGILYCMVKQDYTMQERIVGSLSLKSSSGELESYCLMWSIRPFINDEIVHQAWRFIP